MDGAIISPLSSAKNCSFVSTGGAANAVGTKQKTRKVGLGLDEPIFNDVDVDGLKVFKCS
jgi:hypothetical protein